MIDYDKIITEQDAYIRRLREELNTQGKAHQECRKRFKEQMALAHESRRASELGYREVIHELNDRLRLLNGIIADSDEMLSALSNAEQLSEAHALLTEARIKIAQTSAPTPVEAYCGGIVDKIDAWLRKRTVPTKTPLPANKDTP